jgi:hypothetical protein
MTSNPAKIKKGGHFKQGYYKAINPEKYLGDSNQIIYRSSLEFKVCYKFDRADYIVGWGCESIHIPYISPKDGRTHKYFIDFITITLNKDGSKNVTLIEVKPYAQLLPPKYNGKKKDRFLKEAMTYEINKAKFEYATAYCKKKGWTFIKLTENDILGKL